MGQIKSDTKKRCCGMLCLCCILCCGDPFEGPFVKNMHSALAALRSALGEPYGARFYIIQRLIKSDGQMRDGHVSSDTTIEDLWLGVSYGQEATAQMMALENDQHPSNFVLGSPSGKRIGSCDPFREAWGKINAVAEA